MAFVIFFVKRNFLETFYLPTSVIYFVIDATYIRPHE